MRCRIFAIAATASSLLLIAIIVLWLRSYWRADFVQLNGGAFGGQIITARGHLMVQWLISTAPWPKTEWFYQSSRAPDLTAGNWRLWTQSQPHTIPGIIVWGRRSVGFFGSSGTGLAILLPYWLLGLISMIVPAAWLRVRLRARRRQRAGLCQVCGYDLRATPDRCPECGATAARPQTTTSL